MYIREATLQDSDELQRLQAICPQGTSLIVSTINTPDFFARVKAYESYKVFVLCEQKEILGSAACALRNAVVNGEIQRVGYEFQYFTSPNHRRKKIAMQLRQRIEEYLVKQGAVISYALIMEDNLPSIRLFENEGFNLHRTLIMSGLAIRKEMKAYSSDGRINSVKPQDLPKVAELLNTTWQGYELYEPYSGQALQQFINRTPEFDFNNLLVLEKDDNLLACLGWWDWSQVMQVTVKALSRKLRLTGLLLSTTGLVPRFPKPGDTIKQMMLTHVGYYNPEHITVLIWYLNNLAFKKGIEQLFFVCEPRHSLLKGMKGFIRVDNKVHLFIKQLSQNISITNGPVFVHGIDL